MNLMQSHNRNHNRYTDEKVGDMRIVNRTSTQDGGNDSGEVHMMGRSTINKTSETILIIHTSQ